jgi:hypothetical protein
MIPEVSKIHGGQKLPRGLGKGIVSFSYTQLKSSHYVQRTGFFGREVEALTSLEP